MGCEEKLELVSRYIDDELSSEERSAFEEHLKRCEACRRALGEMRGTDGLVGKVVRTHRVGERFVRRVMGRLSRPRGKWLVVGGGLLVALVFCAGVAWFAPWRETERAGTVLRAPEGSLINGRAAFEGMELPVGGEAKTAEAGLVLKLAHARLYLGSGTELRVDSSRQAALLSGEVFVEARGFFRLKLRPALSARTEGARFLAIAEGITVVAGRVTVPFAGRDLDVPHGRRMRLGVNEFWVDDVDLRALRPGYVPAGLLSSPWPAQGGDERGSGFSPFPLPGSVRIVDVVELAPGLGAPVLAGGDEPVVASRSGLFFVKGGKPERVDLPGGGGAAGSPYVFEKGVAVCVAGKGVAVVSRGVVERTLVCDAVAGCLVSWETVFVPVSGGLAAFGLDGGVLWAQPLAGTKFRVSKWKGIVFAACKDGYLRALDAATGQVLASSLVRPAGFASPPATTPQGRCYAVSGSQLVWLERDGRTGVIDLPEGDYPVPPAVDASGALYLCDGEGGLWKVVGGRPARLFDAGSGATAQPVCDIEGNVLVPAGAELVCVRRDGRELWRVDLGRHVGRSIVGIAALPDGSLVVAGESKLILLEPTP